MKRTEIEWMPIGSVKPYDRNPRRNDAAVDAVANSITEFGFKNPIIVDKDLVIIAGHTRLKAAKKLGLKEVPVVIASDLSEEQAKAYRIADNSVADLSEWDYDKLLEEIDSIDFDMSDFGFKFVDDEVDFSDLEQRMAEKTEEQLEFEDKFKVKHTTDDCFTPPAVYEAVKSWVFNHYKIPQDREVVRPFYPGGDYQHHEYPKGCLVLDNPPFSIMSEIVRFYKSKGIDFFLFAQGVTLMQTLDITNVVVAGIGVVYENGANIHTGFVTSLGFSKVTVSASLYEVISEAQPSDATELNAYGWPDNVISGALLGKLPKYGTEMEIRKTHFVRKVGTSGVGIYGGGGLVSDMDAEKLKAEKLKAEKLKAEKQMIPIIFTADERKIIASLEESDDH